MNTADIIKCRFGFYAGVDSRKPHSFSRGPRVVSDRVQAELDIFFPPGYPAEPMTLQSLFVYRTRRNPDMTDLMRHFT